MLQGQMMIIIICYFALVIGVVEICCIENKKGWKVFTALVIIIFAFTVASTAFHTIAKDEIYRELTQEVNLKQISAEDGDIIQIQVRVLKNEGNENKVEALTLVPKSTVIIPKKSSQNKE